MTTASDRTPRLHLVATLTIWASEKLSPNEKIVWYHTWALDSSPIDACYMSARSMGQRLGLSPKTIEGIRTRLAALDLMDSFPRPGSNQPGWVAQLPASLVPPSRDLQTAVREAPALAQKLDARITGEDAILARRRAEGPPDIQRNTVPRADGGQFRKRAEGCSANARSARSGEGVGGGASRLSADTIQRSLPPAVTEHLRQMGDGSSEPENRDERPLTPAERHALAEADKRAADETTEQGFQNLRETIRKRNEEASRQRAERFPEPLEETGT